MSAAPRRDARGRFAPADRIPALVVAVETTVRGPGTASSKRYTLLRLLADWAREDGIVVDEGPEAAALADLTRISESPSQDGV